MSTTLLAWGLADKRWGTRQQLETLACHFVKLGECRFPHLKVQALVTKPELGQVSAKDQRLFLPVHAAVGLGDGNSVTGRKQRRGVPLHSMCGCTVRDSFCPAGWPGQMTETILGRGAMGVYRSTADPYNAGQVPGDLHPGALGA